MRNIYKKLIIMTLSITSLFIMAKSVNSNIDSEVKAAAPVTIQAALTSYTNADINSKYSLTFPWYLSYVDPNTNIGLYLIGGGKNFNNLQPWNTKCAANRTCLNAGAYEAGELYATLKPGTDIPGVPGSKSGTLTKSEYDSILLANNNNYSVLVDLDGIKYWLATAATATDVYVVDQSGRLTTAAAGASAAATRGVKRISLELATISASRTSTFAMREGNYQGSLTDFKFSDYTLDTAGSTITYVVKSGDPGGVFKASGGNNTKQTSLQLANGLTSFNGLVANHSGSTVQTKTYSIVVAPDEWKLTKSQPTPATINIKVKPPFPTNTDVTWKPVTGYDLSNIPKNTPVGTKVATISLDKYTSDAKTTVKYSTTSSSAADPFKINTNGDVVVQRALNASETFTKDVKVNLVDSELDPLSVNVQSKDLVAPTNIVIGVGKVLESSFKETTNSNGSKISFREGEANVAVNAVMGKFTSIGNSGNVVYTIQGAGSNNFAVSMDADNINASLIAKNALTAGTYNLTIEAKDDAMTKSINVTITVLAAYKEITDYSFVQVADLREGQPIVAIGKPAGTLSAKGEGTLSYSLTSGYGDNSSFKIAGANIVIDSVLVAKTYNLEVEISDATSGKKKLVNPQVSVAGQFPAITDVGITPEGLWEYKSNNTTANKRLGRFAPTGGTAGYTYSFTQDADLGAQNASFEIKNDELWIGLSDLVAGNHKINVTVEDANKQKFTKALVIEIARTDQSFTIKNSNATAIPLSDTTMKLTVDNGLMSTVQTTYEIRDGKNTVASIVGDTITFLNEGEFSVVASNGGDSNYKEYETTPKTFVIDKSSITLQAVDKAMLVGESVPSNALLLVSGNVNNNDLSLLGTPSFIYLDSNNQEVALANLKSTGSYKIVPSLNENEEMKKYNITYSNKGTLTISQDTPDENYYSIQPAKNEAGWYKGDPNTKAVTITPLGYKGYTKISGDGGVSFSASNTLRVSEEKVSQLQIVLKKDSGAITSSKQEAISLDATAPTATVLQYQSINQSVLKQMLRAMSFNHIFSEDQRITFSASDLGGSTLDGFVYVLTTYDANGNPISVGTQTKVDANNPTLDLVSSNRYSIEVKAVDKAGNEGASTKEVILLDKGEIQLRMSVKTGSTPYDGSTWTSEDISVDLSSTGSLEVKEYLVKEGDGEYIAVSQNPYIINQDKNDVVYSFKAVSLAGKESLPMELSIKRDCVKPAFRVDTTVNGIKYISGSATAEDILFTLVKNDGNVNIAPVTYYYATSAIGINDNGWIPIEQNASTKLINYNTTDTFYFKAVSEAGVSSERIDGPTLQRFKPGESAIIVSKTLQGNSAKPYDGSWTKEDVVFTLQGGIDDPSKIKTYQYTTTQGSDEVSSSNVWKDMKEKGAGSTVNNQLRIQTTNEDTYFFRVQVLDTEDVYSTTSKHSVKVDKTIPETPTISYAPYTRDQLQLFLNAITFDQVFASAQKVSFASSDAGGSELKSFTYVIKQIDEDGNVLPDPISKSVAASDPSFTLDEDNRYIIEVKAIDGAGNESALTSKQVLLDASEPSISVGAKLGSSSGIAYNGTTWTAQDIYLEFATDASLGAKKYQYKVDDGAYQDVPTPMIINTDQDAIYTFKAISHADKESSEVSLPIKRDSVKPVFHVDTFAGDEPYESGSATDKDITFNFIKDEASVNPSGIQYYYATSPLGISDSGWIAIAKNIDTMKITTSNSDTYYFKAVSDAGISSDIVYGPTLLLVKSEATTITIKKTLNAQDAQPYDGNFTKEDVVFDLSGGVSDVSTIKTYQYTTTSDGSQPTDASIWHDMVDRSDDSLVPNRLRIAKTTAQPYFFRVQVKDTELSYAQSSGQMVQIDKDDPTDVAISYASLQRNALETLLNVVSFDQLFKEKQVVSFQASDIGGSGIKEYMYTLSTLDESGAIKTQGIEQKLTTSNPSFQINKNERYLIEVYAVDKAGNQGVSTSSNILIDDSDPVMKLTATLKESNGAKYVSDTWTSEDIYLHLDSTIDLGVKEYQVNIGEGVYTKVANNPLIVKQDANGIVYSFKAISQSDKESEEKRIVVKRDSVVPAFYVEASIDGNPYIDATPTNQDVLFTMRKNEGNVNLSPVTYYYATSPLGIDEAGWTKIENNETTLTIDESSSDTYYFKAVSEAGLSSIVMKSATLQIVKEAGSNIEVTRSINGDPSSSYSGNWTNQKVVITLAKGMVDPTMIKSYQYCEVAVGEAPDFSTLWYDMSEKASGSSVYNQLTIASSTNKDYYFRVMSTGTGNTYSQTGKSPIRIDTQLPKAPSITYQPGDEEGEQNSEYHKTFLKDQSATFTGIDVGGSEIKSYRYMVETLNAQEEVLSTSGEVEVPIQNPVLQLRMGSLYRITLRSMDYAGNLSEPMQHIVDMLGNDRLDQIEEPDSGIVVEGKDSTTFDKDTIVEVKLITSQIEDVDLAKFNERLGLLSKLPKDSEIKDVYTIKLMLNGVEIQSPGRVKVKIPLTSELLKLQNRRVVYIDDDGNVSLMASYEDGKYIIFETNHFSNYAITGKTKPDSHLNYDSDDDGFPDVNIDIDGDGEADLNIDTNGDLKPNVNFDIDGDGKADYNIDIKPSDGVPDVNIGPVKLPWESDYCTEVNEVQYCSSTYFRPYLNVDTDRDGRGDINVDLNMDMEADLNIDVDGDTQGKDEGSLEGVAMRKPEVNIDSTGNTKEDINIDENNDGISDKTPILISIWKPEMDVNGQVPYDTMGNLLKKEDAIETPEKEDPKPPVLHPSIPNTPGSVQGAYQDNLGGAATADTSNMKLWLYLSIGSILGIIGLGLWRSHKRN